MRPSARARAVQVDRTFHGFRESHAGPRIKLHFRHHLKVSGELQGKRRWFLLDTGLALPVTANAHGLPIRLLVDAGATYSMLDRAQKRRLKLRTIDTETRIVGVGRTGSAELHAATLSSLELGELTLQNVMFGVTDLSSWGIGGRAKSMTDLQGILGADRLLLNRAFLDYPALKLWLRPTQPPNLEMSGSALEVAEMRARVTRPSSRRGL